MMLEYDVLVVFVTSNEVFKLGITYVHQKCYYNSVTKSFQ